MALTSRTRRPTSSCSLPLGISSFCPSSTLRPWRRLEMVVMGRVIIRTTTAITHSPRAITSSSNRVEASRVAAFTCSRITPWLEARTTSPTCSSRLKGDISGRRMMPVSSPPRSPRLASTCSPARISAPETVALLLSPSRISPASWSSPRKEAMAAVCSTVLTRPSSWRCWLPLSWRAITGAVMAITTSPRPSSRAVMMAVLRRASRLRMGLLTGRRSRGGAGGLEVAPGGEAHQGPHPGAEIPAAHIADGAPAVGDDIEHLGGVLGLARWRGPPGEHQPRPVGVDLGQGLVGEQLVELRPGGGEVHRQGGDAAGELTVAAHEDIDGLVPAQGGEAAVGVDHQHQLGAVVGQGLAAPGQGGK